MYLSLILLAFAGICIGVLSGLLGIGGGTLIIPLLRLGFGVDALSAVGTSLFAIIPTSVSGLIGHLRNRTANVKLGLFFGLFGALCAPLGSMVSEHVGGTVVMVCAGCVIAYTACTMLRKALKLPSQKQVRLAVGKASDISTESGVSTAQGSDLPREFFVPVSISYNAKTVLKAAFVGMSAGFASGFLGVGGGFIIVPLSLWLFKLPMKEAAGTSLIAVVLFAIPGAITHGLIGNIEYLEGLMISVGSIPGAFIGSALSKRVPERVLRMAFGVILIIAGVLLVLNEFVIM